MYRAIAINLIVAAAAVGVSTPAAADPPTGGCATGNRESEVQVGMLRLSVADLTADGYRVPAILDDPANGGNGDGFVCAVPQGSLTTSRGGQLYFFFDNQFFPRSA